MYPLTRTTNSRQSRIELPTNDAPYFLKSIHGHEGLNGRSTGLHDINLDNSFGQCPTIPGADNLRVLFSQNDLAPKVIFHSENKGEINAAEVQKAYCETLAHPDAKKHATEHLVKDLETYIEKRKNKPPLCCLFSRVNPKTDPKIVTATAVKNYLTKSEVKQTQEGLELKESGSKVYFSKSTLGNIFSPSRQVKLLPRTVKII